MDLKLFLFLAMLAVAAGSGWAARSVIAQRDKAEFEAAQGAQLAAAIEERRQAELKLRAEAQTAYETYNAEKERLDAELDNAMRELERLRADRAASGTDLPNLAGAPARACPVCPNRPSEPGRLNTEQERAILKLAQECDVIAAGRNALLDMYKAAQAAQ